MCPLADLSYTVDPAERLVEVTGTGEAQAPEWIALFDRVLADPGFEAGMDFLIDRSRITSIPTRETVDRVVRYYAEHARQLGRCRVASVTRDDAAYGMTRMASVFAEQTTVTLEVFRDRESAYRWLRS
jgi:hypothetical protein